MNRNLVLIDGRRVAPVTREGTVDPNMVPSGPVKRIEVVTRRHQYGSDAIAGAIKIRWISSRASRAGGLRHHPGRGWRQDPCGAAGGAGFAADRGHFVLGVEYAKQDGIGDCFTRSYCDGGAASRTRRCRQSGGTVGQPNFYRVEQTGFIANTRGVINVLNNATGDGNP